MAEGEKPTDEMTVDEFHAAYAPWFVKMDYQPIFGVPGEPWRVDAAWRGAFFRASREIVQGVVEGRLRPAIEGIAGVFLFRHHVELMLKWIVFRARWLETQDKNAARESINDLFKHHSLMAFWNAVKGEARPLLGAEWDALDTAFVERCVREFEAVDPDPGWRFRYHALTFGVDKRPEAERVPSGNVLQIDLERLLSQMQHVHDVLNAIYVHLVERHGENADYEAELRAL
ncbi:MAG: hypothetical protein AB7L71_00020 [Vicinamibacterales bacterium]